MIFTICRDGTSIILSDDVGQLYILNTGQGESQNDAQYDQVSLFFFFFFRPKKKKKRKRKKLMENYS